MIVNKMKIIKNIVIAIAISIASFLILCSPFFAHLKYHTNSEKTTTIKENLVGSKKINLGGDIISSARDLYNKGFNDALYSMALLDLELKLNGERKNWGERADILRKRFNVTKPNKTIFRNYNE